MKERYLEVTFRNGRPLAAYLYLPRIDGDRSVRTEETDSGLLIDYAEDGRPIGIEITAPENVTVPQLNAVLDRLGIERLRPDETAPLHAA